MDEGAIPAGRRAGMRLEYPVEVGGAIERNAVPILIGVVGDFGPIRGDTRELRDRSFAPVTLDRLTALEAEEGATEAIGRLKELVAAASDPGENVRISVLDATKEELISDFRQSSSIERSQLFRKVYEEAYGVFGGIPVAMLLVNYPLARGAEDLRLLEELAAVGARAGCVVLTEARAEFLGVASMRELETAEALGHLNARMASKPYAAWQAFRDRDEAGFAALTVLGTVMDVGQRLVEAFLEAGQWASAALLEESDGHSQAVTNAHDALSNHGLLAASAPLTEARTAQRPPSHRDARKRAAAEAAVGLLHTLAASQFLHAATCFSRDMIGAYPPIEDLADRLNEWIGEYVASGGHPSDSRGYQAPLQEASLQLQDVVGEPGRMDVILRMRIGGSQQGSAPMTVHSMRTVPPAEW